MIDPRFDPLPDYPIQRVERLARDLAWGEYYGKWGSQLSVRHEFVNKALTDMNEELSEYISRVWDNAYPDLNLLIKFGLIHEVGSHGGMKFSYELTSRAYLLLNATISASAFISYRRNESSALALLIVARMKEHGLAPFLDMHPDEDADGNRLTIGGDWAAELKEAIEVRDYFVVLVGPKTFEGDSFVVTELSWALDSKKKIIPIWHNQFDPDKHLSTTLSKRIREAVSKTNSIRVEAENPKQYNAVLIQLLAQFGIVP